MIERDMQVVYPGDKCQHLVFDPEPTKNFGSIDFKIPAIIRGLDWQLFRNDLKDSVGKACGRTACGGNIEIRKRELLSGPDYIFVDTAKLQCDEASCPLGEQPDTGEAGDREPKEPAPSSPVTEVELLIPFD